LAIYERLLRSGQMRPCTWATAYCKETNQTYRINGKHTSILYAGIIQKEPNILEDQVVIIEHYVCDTLEDVARLYATFDSRAAVRTGSDLARAFAASVPELSQLRTATIRLAVTALSMDHNPIHWYTEFVADRTERILDNVEFVVWLEEMFGEETRVKRHIARGPVAAAMCTTWRKSHKAATEFWLAVRDETGDKPKLPDRTLARYLLTTSIGIGQGSRRAASRCDPAIAFYVKCIHAWNAWRSNKGTDLKYYAAAKIPSAI